MNEEGRIEIDDISYAHPNWVADEDPVRLADAFLERSGTAEP